ncbi:MAG: ABC transporter permease [Acidimicrobiia bacterium]
MWRATVKGLLGHKLRMALTVLAITIGVGFVAGSFVFTDTLGSVFDDLFAGTTEGIDVTVRPVIATGNDFGFSLPERIPAAVLEDVRAVDGVEEATGSLFWFVQLLDKNGDIASTTGPPTFGASWTDTNRPGAFSLREGARPSADGQVALDRKTAERLGFSIGDTVQIVIFGPPESFTLVGLAGFGEADNLGGAGFALFDLSTAQRLFNSGDAFDTIEVAATPGVSPEALVERIQPILPAKVEAVTAQSVAEEQAAALKEGLGFFNTFLLVFAGIALFVGTFIIQNTFRIIVAQRTRELALFRALGATSRQVTGMVLSEAAIVGVISSGLGLVFGVGLANVLAIAYEFFGGDLPEAALEVRLRTVLVALAVGVLVTLVSALLPARKAASVPPVAAMRDVESTTFRSMRTRAIAGGAITAFGVALGLLGLFVELPVDWIDPIALVGAGAAVVFIGVAVISPLFTRLVSGTIGAPFPRLFALPGILARENSMRKPRRTAATAAALMIGLALVSLATILAASFRGTVRQVIDDSFRADLVISELGFGGIGFSPSIADGVALLPEIDTLARTRFGQAAVNENPVFVSAVQTDTFLDLFSIDLIDGGFEALTSPSVALRASRAEALGVGVGDTVTMTFARTGVQQLPVVAIWDGQGIQASFLISLETFEANFLEQLDAQVLIALADGATIEEGRAAVESVTGAFPNVQIQDQADFKKQTESQINLILSLIFVMLLLSVFIALLGITNTLSLSIIERTREIGLLRAVGMSRKQVRRMIRWESVIISVFGAVLGIVLGIIFGWAVVRALSDQGLLFVLPTGQLIGALFAAGVAGVVAAILPAWRASRLNVLEAIAYE